MKKVVWALSAALFIPLLVGIGPAAGSFSGSPGLIAFARSGDRPGIRVMQPDGSQLRRITRSFDTIPTWSPDGTQIAFVRWNRAFSITKMVVVNADGSDQRVVSTPTREFCPLQTPSWSFDGRFLAYTSDCFDEEPRVAQLRVAAADGSGEISLTDYSSLNHLGPQPWSPDLEGSMRLTFISDRDGDTEVYTVNSDGTEVTQLTDDGDDQFEAGWSPDGDVISYSTQTISASGDPRNSIFTIPSQGGEETLLVEGEPHATNALWSPDGSKLLYAHRNRIGVPTATVVERDGSNEVSLGKGLEPADAAWSPNGRSILFAADGDIVRVRLGGGSRRLTSSRADDGGPDWQALLP